MAYRLLLLWGMNPMIERAALALRRRRGELARVRRSNVESEAVALEEAPADWTDRATDREEAGLLDTLAERERAELTEVDDALSRVQAGTFGSCETCGGPIGRQRLAAVPYTRYCVTCEERTERG
jgi:DnaK suppressor protein